MARTLTIDDEVFQALQDRAEPLVDDANSVLRRLLNLPAPAPNSAAAAVPSPTRAGPASRPKGTSPVPLTRRAQNKAGSKRAARGTLLPESAYELPMLHALEESNGRAPAVEAIDRVGDILGDRLQPVDREVLDSGLVRWKNRAQFVRLGLVRSGDLKKDSPRGVWEITEQGRRRIAGTAASTAPAPVTTKDAT